MLYAIFDSMLMSFGKELMWMMYKCWSCWWMLRRSDVEVGSSPIFPGFLAPHGHIFSHLYSMSLAQFEVWSPLGYCCLYWIYLEYLARFDNFYEIFGFVLNIEWIFPSSFECKRETHQWGFDFWWRHWFELLWLYEDGIKWFWRLWSMLLRVFIFAIHLWFRVIAWGQASISLGMFDECQKYMF